MPKGALGEFVCPRCGHRRKHEFNVLGQAKCSECTDGVCTEPSTIDMLKPSPATWGMGFLNEMGKDALISEIVTAHCVQLQRYSMDQLRHMVVMVRLQGVRDRLMVEAGLEDDDNEGWMG